MTPILTDLVIAAGIFLVLLGIPLGWLINHVADLEQRLTAMEERE